MDRVSSMNGENKKMIVVGKSEAKGRPRSRWLDNIKMDLEEIWYGTLIPRTPIMQTSICYLKAIVAEISLQASTCNTSEESGSLLLLLLLLAYATIVLIHET
jgi:hypothetical protein